MISPCGRGEPETTSACGGPAGSSRSSNACTSLMRSIVRLEIYGISVIHCYFNRLCEMRARARRGQGQGGGKGKAAASARRGQGTGGGWGGGRAVAGGGRGQGQGGGKPKTGASPVSTRRGVGRTGARAGRRQGYDGGKGKTGASPVSTRRGVEAGLPPVSPAHPLTSPTLFPDPPSYLTHPLT